MGTIEGNQLVSAAFEACATFGDAGDASPVCTACGWLEAEHEPEAAEVRLLPTRTAQRPTPQRLAS